jgi:hypothetical protein
VEDDHIAAGGAASPGKGCQGRQPDPPIETYPHPIQTHSLDVPNFQLPVAGPSTGFGTLMSAMSTYNSPGPSFTSLPPSALALSSMFPLPIPFADAPLYSPSVPDYAGTSSSASPMLPQHTIPLPCTSSHSGNCQVSPWLVPDAQFWSAIQQKQFERLIACLTASAGLPLSWVDNAEWIASID